VKQFIHRLPATALSLAPVITLALALSACASSEMKSIEQNTTPQVEASTGHPATGNSLQTKFVAAEQGANATAELTFKKASAKLPKDAAGKLRKAMKEAAAKGRVSEIKIITWADQEYPSTFKGELPEGDRSLAAARGEAVAKLLAQTAGSAQVEKISMAERPGALGNFFKTSDFRVKRSLERAGIPNENTGVKVPAMAKKALVLFLVEGAQAAE